MERLEDLMKCDSEDKKIIERESDKGVNYSGKETRKSNFPQTPRKSKHKGHKSERSRCDITGSPVSTENIYQGGLSAQLASAGTGLTYSEQDNQMYKNGKKRCGIHNST